MHCSNIIYSRMGGGQAAVFKDALTELEFWGDILAVVLISPTPLHSAPLRLPSAYNVQDTACRLHNAFGVRAACVPHTTCVRARDVRPARHGRGLLCSSPVALHCIALQYGPVPPHCTLHEVRCVSQLVGPSAYRMVACAAATEPPRQRLREPSGIFRRNCRRIVLSQSTAPL